MFEHYKNKKHYQLKSECKLQEDGEWKEAVIYSEVGGEDLFVRLKSEFFEKFKLIDG